MFLARDRKLFSRELQALAGRGAKDGARPDDTAAKIAAANAVLEKSVQPLFEAYAEIVRGCGKTCEFKVLLGSAETHPRRSAIAEFLVELQEVPGLAEYYFRLETEGGDWELATRPRLDGKGRRYEVGHLTLPVTGKLPAAIEGALQQFIRLLF